VARSSALILLAGLGLVAGATAAGAQSTSDKSLAPLAGEFRTIQIVGSNSCLQPEGGSSAQWTPIVLATCNGSTAQGWKYQDLGKNHYSFLNPNGWCLYTVDDPADRSAVFQDACQDSNAEWNSGVKLPDVVSLRTRVRYRDNNFCLDVPGGVPTEGLRVQLWACNGSLAQRWIVGF